MTDRPIIFSAPMVRALLDGRKTQTRRILGGRGHCNIFEAGVWSDSYVLDPGNAEWRARDTPYAVGDRLYVREHWKTSLGNDGVAPRDLDRDTPVLYLADMAERGQHAIGGAGKHRQGMHMPRWASRLTLITESVKVERLQDISEADAVAEGIVRIGVDYGAGIRPTSFDNGPNLYTVNIDGGSHSAPSAAEVYRMLWQHLHGDGSWDANPWVVAVTFRVERGNIDRLPQ